MKRKNEKTKKPGILVPVDSDGVPKGLALLVGCALARAGIPVGTYKRRRIISGGQNG